ncbi:MAG: DUF3470 domain-containing protein [Sphingomonas sp.]|nr:DUF3470 domain-containing protein [Sphingomonas sp.]
MTAVITDSCIKCKHMACVEVCPVDAFYEGENMLVINPTECVDCGCCIVECPIDAIVFDDDPRAGPWIELNAKYAAIWPNVTFDGGQTPADADQFKGVDGKFERYFSAAPGAGDIGVRPIRARARNCGHHHGETLLNRMTRLLGRFWR